MPRRVEDPASLEGEALAKWYRRTPDEIEGERRAAEEERYDSFFGAVAAQPAPTSRDGAAAYRRAQATDDDALWLADGRGGFRRIRSYGGQGGVPDDAPEYPAPLPSHAAAPEVAEFEEVGNPHTPRPRTEGGRNYDVAHIRAIADGGTNNLDNIRPMHPVPHQQSHARDRARWGLRPHIARVFGGRVEPPAHAPRRSDGTSVRGSGLLGLIPNLTGILSGRIRTDTQERFFNDMLGYSSEDDLPKRDLIA